MAPFQDKTGFVRCVAPLLPIALKLISPKLVLMQVEMTLHEPYSASRSVLRTAVLRALALIRPEVPGYGPAQFGVGFDSARARAILIAGRNATVACS